MNITILVPKGKEYDYSNPAVQGVQFCSKLFDYERYSKEKGHSFDQRKEYRIQKEKPVLDSFFIWLENQKPKRGSRFAKAVNYAQNRKTICRPIWKMGIAAFRIIFQKMRSDHLQSVEKTGCSAILPKELRQVPQFTQW